MCIFAIAILSVRLAVSIQMLVIRHYAHSCISTDFRRPTDRICGNLFPPSPTNTHVK